MKVKKALQPIENTFEIQIPDDEVFYVMDFFIKKSACKKIKSRQFFSISNVTPILSAIFKIYQRNSDFISNFSNISIYRQESLKFAPYSKKGCSKIWTAFFLLLYFPNSPPYFALLMGLRINIYIYIRLNDFLK